MEVSLCAQAYTSTSSTALTVARVPGVADTIWLGARKGAELVASLNLFVNSPKTACWARSRTSENVAASQNDVLPPFPRSTS